MGEFSDHYEEWRETRMRVLQTCVDPAFFRGKTLLEPGCGFADIGAKFAELGAIVTSTDARQEHINVARTRHPNLTFGILDADNDKIPRKFDVIVHWGLLYHLRNIEGHLADVCANCDYLFLESVVIDSADKNSVKMRKETGYDQSIHGIGTHPSWEMINNLLTTYRFLHRRIADSSLNSTMHVYDWPTTRSNPDWRRAFWICWREGLPSPLRP